MWHYIDVIHLFHCSWCIFLWQWCLNLKWWQWCKHPTWNLLYNEICKMWWKWYIILSWIVLFFTALFSGCFVNKAGFLLVGKFSLLNTFSPSICYLLHRIVLSWISVVAPIVFIGKKSKLIRSQCNKWFPDDILNTIGDSEI